jgi:hypothetical protein
LFAPKLKKVDCALFWPAALALAFLVRKDEASRVGLFAEMQLAARAVCARRRQARGWSPRLH